MFAKQVCTVASAAALVLSAAVAFAGNWPAWRGATGIGIAEAPQAPLSWSTTENVKWKVALPDGGNGTPVVWGDRVFITQAQDEGRTRALMCFNRETGEQLWSQEIRYEEKESTHRTNPYCSSSPVTDGERIFVWHGSAGFYAYDMDGKELWKKDLGKFEHIWGNASSPILYQDQVILHAGPGRNTFLISMNQKTGEETWRNSDLVDTTRRRSNDRGGSWSTPVLYEDNGRTLLLLSVPHQLVAFDPSTGSKVWWCDGLTQLVYTSPLVGDGVAVAMSGYGGAAIAVRTGGTGDVTETHRLWRHERNPQRVGSGVIVGDHLYILHDTGVAWCLDVQSGERLWEARLGGAWSSMVHVGDKLYVIDQSGATHVLEVNPDECKVLATNRLGETTRASLAFADRQIFIRTYKHLYCVETP